MIDANRLLDQLMKSGVGGGLAGGLLSGAIAGAMTGKGRKLGSSALKAGGLALVAGLAYKAWQQYQAGQRGPGTIPGAVAGLFGATGAAGTEQPPPVNASDALPVLRAMIAAAKADGQVDAAEHQRIFGEIGRLGLSADEKAFVLEEIARPLDLEAVVASASTPELAREVYAASRLIVAETSPAEGAYLQLLAARLGLPAALVAEIDRAARELPAG